MQDNEKIKEQLRALIVKIQKNTDVLFIKIEKIPDFQNSRIFQECFENILIATERCDRVITAAKDSNGK